MVQSIAEGLLLRYLSAGDGSAQHNELDQVSNEDWEKAIQLSIKHGITPLFYQRLRANNGRFAVPPHIEPRLRGLYHRGALESMAQQREFGSALQLLHDENVPIIVLKGAHLGGVVYEDVTLRSMCDVDILVRKLDLARAEKVLLEAGIDWDQLQSRAHQWRACQHVHLVLYLARELLVVPVPERVLTDLQTGQLDPELIALVSQKVYGHHSLRSPDFIKFWGTKSIRDKIVLLSRSIFPSLEAMAQMYPASPDSLRIYGYYPVRLKDILSRYGRMAWHLLWRNKQLQALVKRENEMIEWLTPLQ